MNIKKTLEMEVQLKLSKRLKPHAVEVIARGRIDGTYEGKITWDDLMRSTTPYYLDVSIIHVREQNPSDITTL